jgi:hypothetical protein
MIKYLIQINQIVTSRDHFINIRMVGVTVIGRTINMQN